MARDTLDEAAMALARALVTQDDVDRARRVEQTISGDGRVILPPNTNLGGAWDGQHPVLGNVHLWVDTSGNLRAKVGRPSSATDGTIISGGGSLSVANTTSINLDLTGGTLTANANFGTTSGTVASGLILHGLQNTVNLIDADLTTVEGKVLPAGGSIGQALVKKSGTDYDTQWQSVASGSSTWGSITGTLSSQTDLQSALNAKADNSNLIATNLNLSLHTNNTSNPHGVTKSQVGLGNVPNADYSTRVLPSGGSTGQVLAKTSGTNYAVGWTTPTGGGTTTVTTTTTQNFGTIAAGKSVDKTISNFGVAANDPIVVGPPAGIPAGMLFQAFYDSGLIIFSAYNVSGSSITMGSATYRLTAIKP